MARKKQWRYKANIGRIKGLAEGKVYGFNPKFQTDGTVKCKILGDAFTQKMTFGYNTVADFNEDWEEA